MAEGTTARIDAALASDEVRLDLIRKAIENELTRRSAIERELTRRERKG